MKRRGIPLAASPPGKRCSRADNYITHLPALRRLTERRFARQGGFVLFLDAPWQGVAFIRSTVMRYALQQISPAQTRKGFVSGLLGRMMIAHVRGLAVSHMSFLSSMDGLVPAGDLPGGSFGFACALQRA